MQTQLAADRPRTLRKKSRFASLRSLGWVLVGFIGFAGLVGYALLFLGHITGEEFAPGSFSRRRFSFLEIPLLGLQISPVQRTDITSELEFYLRSHKLIDIQDLANPDQRWDLVAAFAVGREGPDAQPRAQGEARILCEYLDAQDRNQKRIWLNWSKQNPQLAQVLWPFIARLARQELYVFVPDLFQLARNATDPNDLKEQINRLLAEKYTAWGKSQQALEHHDAAVEVFQYALECIPDHPEALLGIRERQGQAEKPPETEKAADAILPSRLQHKAVQEQPTTRDHQP